MSEMRERIDPLISERAAWLHQPNTFARTARALLEGVLGYGETIRLAERFSDMPADEIMAEMATRLAKDVTLTGLHNIPATGPALIVSNHPTGIADGVILHSVITRLRADPYYFANRDISRVLPQMDEMIAPVEWLPHKRSAASARETMRVTRDAVQDGRIGVIFPSGRLAKRRGLTLHERPWMPSAARLARKFDLPVIPVHIRARNSAMFYLFDMLHPSLRDITLFHETLNKDRQPYRVSIGAPISPSAIPDDSEQGIAMLREITLGLAEQPRLSSRGLHRPVGITSSG